MGNDKEDDFIRNWSGRAFDEAQLAQIQEIERHIIKYARTAWRPMDIPPPEYVLLLGVSEEGIVLLVNQGQNGWRTRDGLPHKPPLCWMPAPDMPEIDRMGQAGESHRLS